MFKRLKIRLRRFKPLFCRHEVGRYNYSCLVFYHGIAGKIGTVYCKKCGKKMSERFLSLSQVYGMEDYI